MKLAINFIAIVVLGGLFTLPFLAMAAANPAGTSGSWVHYAMTDMGADSSCAASQGVYSFRLYGHNSMTPLTNAEAAGLTLTVRRYSSASGAIVQEKSVSNRAISDTICYDPNSESVWPKVSNDGTGDYYAHDSVGFNDYNSTAWRSRHIRGAVHLRPIASSPTAIATYPNNQIIKDTTPTFAWTINAVNSQYSASNGVQSIMWSWDTADPSGTRSSSGGFFTDTADAGNRTRTPRTFTQGLWGWEYTYIRNGPAVVLDGLSFTANGGRPEMGLATNAYFMVDVTDPTSATSHVRSVSGSDSIVTFTNAARDVLSGLDFTSLVTQRTSPASTGDNRVRTNFTVGSGVSGGPTGTQTTSIPLSLEPGATYDYYFITDDAAGNRIVSATKSVTTMIPPAPSASLTGVGCTIASGASTCSAISLDWTISNSSNPSVVNTTTIDSFSTSATGANASFPITEGSNTIVARHDTTVLRTITLTGTCIAGTIWASGACRPPVGNISASPLTCTIVSGASLCNIPFTWTTSYASTPNVRNTTRNQQYSTNPSGTNVNAAITEGVNAVVVRESATVLDTVSVTGNCASNTLWSGTACEPPQVNTLSGTGCTVALGASTCNGRLTWDIAYAPNDNVYNSSTGVKYSDNSTGANAVIALRLGSNTIQARTGATNPGTNVISPNGSITVTTTCVSGTQPVAGSCQQSPVLNFATPPQFVRSGKTLDLSWQVTAPYDVTCTVSGNVASGASFTVPANTVAPYLTTTGVITSTNQYTLTCTSTAVPALTTDSTVTVEVVPVVYES